MLQLGIEKFLENPEKYNWGNVALLSNQASIVHDNKESWHHLHHVLGGKLKCLLGPQHGFVSTVQDNMIETSHAIHKPTSLPVYSLYSETREPSEKMLKGVDTIVIDLQISGTRIYTYKYTIAACLRAAVKYQKRVVVLDRPNPLGGVVVEGRVLEDDAQSFVGEFPIPMRHGLSVGEAACFFNHTIGADLDIVWMESWSPSHLWHQNGRPWVLTSPNLPTDDSAYVYPGMVIFEGTNVSEGRGTCRPFQLLGAPQVTDPIAFTERVLELNEGQSPGVFVRPTQFQPTFHKWESQVCGGVDLIVTDPQKVRSYRLSLALLMAFKEVMGKDYKWAQPPYEYETVRLPFQLLIGSLDATERFENDSFKVNDSYWTDGISEYIAKVSKFLHYEREQLVG